MKIYAVPDIHGQKNMLDHALSLIEGDGGRDATVVFLGDLVDRGPDGRGVIDTVIAGQAAGRKWVVIRGNHDQMFLDYLNDARDHGARVNSERSWLLPVRGGPITMKSYGVEVSESNPNWQETRRAVPESHVQFLAGLKFYHEIGDLLFVHAGIAPDVALEHQNPVDLMHIREPFVSYSKPHPWLVVHGHTPLQYPQHFGNRIDLDGGAGYDRPLIPAVFEGRDCWLLTDNGRAPLIP